MTERAARPAPHPWDPALYLAHAAERARPFVELLARVPERGADGREPRRVVDLGCGAGNLTTLLARRWPGASVAGLDSSPDMVAAARAGLAREADDVAARVSYEVADLRDPPPGEPADVVVSNATLQWVPGHLDLLPTLLQRLAPGGVLAFQVPHNDDAPSTLLRRELSRDPRFAAHVEGVAEVAAHDAAVYLDALAPLVAGSGGVVDAWETTYLHVLPGEDAVFGWTSATGLRPTLLALPDEGPDGPRATFEAEHRAALRAAYPATPHGTVMPFRRVFVVVRL